jgi:hypothetical protein
MDEKESLQISMERYYRVVNDLIKKSFPSLKEWDVLIEEDKKIEFSADAKHLKTHLRLRTNFFIREYSEDILKGLFSHELSHLESFIKFGKLEIFLYAMRYNFQSSFKKRIEKETDINSINKGYAKQLYKQRKLRWLVDNKKMRELKKIYLSPEELKRIAIKLDKWNLKKT